MPQTKSSLSWFDAFIKGVKAPFKWIAKAINGLLIRFGVKKSSSKTEQDSAIEEPLRTEEPTTKEVQQDTSKAQSSIADPSVENSIADPHSGENNVTPEKPQEPRSKEIPDDVLGPVSPPTDQSQIQRPQENERQAASPPAVSPEQAILEKVLEQCRTRQINDSKIKEALEATGTQQKIKALNDELFLQIDSKRLSLKNSTGLKLTSDMPADFLEQYSKIERAIDDFDSELQNNPFVVKDFTKIDAALVEYKKAVELYNANKKTSKVSSVVISPPLVEPPPKIAVPLIKAGVPHNTPSQSSTAGTVKPRMTDFSKVPKEELPQQFDALMAELLKLYEKASKNLQSLSSKDRTSQKDMIAGKYETIAYQLFGDQWLKLEWKKYNPKWDSKKGRENCQKLAEFISQYEADLQSHGLLEDPPTPETILLRTAIKEAISDQSNRFKRLEEELAEIQGKLEASRDEAQGQFDGRKLDAARREAFIKRAKESIPRLEQEYREKSQSLAKEREDFEHFKKVLNNAEHILDRCAEKGYSNIDVIRVKISKAVKEKEIKTSIKKLTDILFEKANNAYLTELNQSFNKDRQKLLEVDPNLKSISDTTNNLFAKNYKDQLDGTRALTVEDFEAMENQLAIYDQAIGQAVVVAFKPSKKHP